MELFKNSIFLMILACKTLSHTLAYLLWNKLNAAQLKFTLFGE